MLAKVQADNAIASRQVRHAAALIVVVLACSFFPDGVGEGFFIGGSSVCIGLYTIKFIPII